MHIELGLARRQAKAIASLGIGLAAKDGSAGLRARRTVSADRRPGHRFTRIGGDDRAFNHDAVDEVELYFGRRPRADRNGRGGLHYPGCFVGPIVHLHVEAPFRQTAESEPALAVGPRLLLQSPIPSAGDALQPNVQTACFHPRHLGHHAPVDAALWGQRKFNGGAAGLGGIRPFRTARCGVQVGKPACLDAEDQLPLEGNGREAKTSLGVGAGEEEPLQCRFYNRFCGGVTPRRRVTDPLHSPELDPRAHDRLAFAVPHRA